MKKNLMKMLAVSAFLMAGILGTGAEITDNVSEAEVKQRLNSSQLLVAAKKKGGTYVVCVPAKGAESDEALYREAEECLKGFKDKGAKKPFDFYVSQNLDPVRNYYYNKSGAYYNKKDLSGVTVEYHHMVF